MSRPEAHLRNAQKQVNQLENEVFALLKRMKEEDTFDARYVISVRSSVWRNS